MARCMRLLRKMRISSPPTRFNRQDNPALTKPIRDGYLRVDFASTKAESKTIIKSGGCVQHCRKITTDSNRTVSVSAEEQGDHAQ